jgi:hypothetical protein
MAATLAMACSADGLSFVRPFLAAMPELLNEATPRTNATVGHCVTSKVTATLNVWPSIAMWSVAEYEPTGVLDAA